MDAAHSSTNVPSPHLPPVELTGEAVAVAVTGHPRFRSAGESGDVLLALDGKLLYVYWNHAAEALTGLGAGDVLGRSLYEVFPDAAGSEAEALYLDVLRTGRTRVITTRFADTWYDVAAYPLRTGVLVVARDATAEHSLPQPTSTRQAGLSPFAPPETNAAVAVIKAGSIVAVNDRFAEMFGCTDLHEPVGTSLLGFICPEHRCYVGTLVRNAGTFSPAAVQLNLIALRRDGVQIPVGVSGCSILLREGSASAVFFVDRGCAFPVGEPAK